jgi:N-acetylmuramoyl-L-alanine amidase
MEPLLQRAKVDYHILVPETFDVSLKERCRRANVIHKENNGEAFLISIHANAGGGTGWEVFTSIGETKSDGLASVFFKEAELSFGSEFKMRKDTVDGDPDKESDFYILKHTTCPAILTENFFMDTEKDLEFIISDSGRQRIAEMHVRAIYNYLNQTEA